MNLFLKNNYLSEEMISNQNYSQSNQLYPINTKNNEINLNLKSFFEEKNESEISEEDNLYFIDPPTLSKTDNNKKEKNIEKIFNITKEKIKSLEIKKRKLLNNKRGRMQKAKTKNKYEKDNVKKYHSKLELDNIIHKMKVFFLKSSMKLINNRYKNYEIKKRKKLKKFLWKIKTNFTHTIKRETNLKFLQIKIKDLFSSELSDKCTKLNKEYNKQKIKELYKKGEPQEVIEILEKTVEELLKSYINGDYENEGFYIENDLKKEKEKMINNGEDNIDDYIERFLETAKNFGNIFKKKIPRKTKLRN